MNKTLQKEFKEALELQYSLNSKTCGEDWLKTKSCAKTGKKILWLLDISQECGEAIDSINWKHWKSGTDIDYENLKIEMVDIFHFTLSTMLSATDSDGVEKLSSFMAVLKDTTHKEYKRKVDDEEWKVLVDLFATVQATALYLYTSITTKEEFAERLTDMLVGLFIIEVELNFDLLRLFKLKNVLNEFRQLNGYSEGSYQKLWNGEEDNLYLFKYDEMNKDSDIDANDVMKYLEAEYAKAISC